MKTFKSLKRKEIETVKKVLANFNLSSKQLSIKKSVVANVNDVYLIRSGKSKYILRRSNVHKTLNHLKFEIELLNFLHNKKFKLTPFVYENKSGEQITVIDKQYYCLLNFMPGSTQASWNNLKKFNKRKLVSFFQASAKFSRAAEGFKPKTNVKSFGLYFYLQNGKKLFDEKLKLVPDSDVKRLLLRNKQFIYEFIAQNLRELKSAHYDKLSKQIVHFDLHPGNVNFRGNRVVGIFDFDWARFDNRISDLAGTIGQSCYYYGGPKSGIYDKQKIKLGLKAYRKAYGKSEFDPEDENHLVKISLKSYIFFQLFWCFYWFFKNPYDDPKSFEYFDFMIKILKRNNYDFLFKDI